MPEQTPNGWGEWSRHVLMELKRLNDSLESVVKQHNETTQDLARFESDLRNKNTTCAQHRHEIKELKAELAGVRQSVQGQRLIAIAISSMTSIIVAGISGYFIMHSAGVTQ